MKWHEAYRCKVCGQIHRNLRDRLCKRCGAEISYRNPAGIGSVVNRFATENIEPITIRRVIFGWEVRPSKMPLWVIQGKPPPLPPRKQHHQEIRLLRKGDNPYNAKE